MATIFLDTNILFDIYERDAAKAQLFIDHKLHISPLSYHILTYITKTKIPNTKLNQMLSDFGIISLSSEILMRALQGPTDDLEDNIQLHSAIEANCQYFFTSDKLLLKMAYFGKMAIVDSL